MTLSQARREVFTKSDKVIERETALKWAYRAVACYERAAREVGVKQTGWLLRAADYAHEALEHSATVGDGGRTLKKIQKMLDRAEKAKHSGSRRKKR